jgi:hypothetical protein
MAETKDIKAYIEEVVRERVHSGEIVNITVTRDADEDGDDIFRINVIFDNKKKSLDAAETSQLTRHVWRRLIDLDVRGFPSFSFIAKSEAGKLAAA